MSAKQPFCIEKLALIGVGLIGGSLVQALREQKAVAEVVGVGRSVENLMLAKSLGVVDDYTHDVAEAVRDADMVVIATPVGAFAQILSEVLPALGPNAIVTDVGSVKREIIQSAIDVMGDKVAQFVAAHPVAGSEKSGVGAANPQLFVDHNIILTPLPETNPAFKIRVEEMWRLTGARVVDMDAELHDQILGVTSHLPHVIVYTLINYLAQQNEQEMHYQFAAGGLYDLTRIASSDAVMWSDIFLNNKDKIINIVRDYAAELNTLADQIEADDKTQLVQRFEQAKQVRATLADFRKRN